MHESRRPLVGAVIPEEGAPTGVVLEDQSTHARIGEGRREFIRVEKGAMQAGGISLEHANLLGAAKKSLNTMLDPIVSRYAMALALRSDHDTSETLKDDMVTAAFRSSSISILDVGRRALVDRVEDSQYAKIDRLWSDLERNKSDRAQIQRLRKGDAIGIIGDLIEALRNEFDEFHHTTHEHAFESGMNPVLFAEPELFESIVGVCIDSARRLNLV